MFRLTTVCKVRKHDDETLHTFPRSAWEFANFPTPIVGIFDFPTRFQHKSNEKWEGLRDFSIENNPSPQPPVSNASHATATPTAVESLLPGPSRQHVHLVVRRKCRLIVVGQFGSRAQANLAAQTQTTQQLRSASGDEGKVAGTTISASDDARTQEKGEIRQERRHAAHLPQAEHRLIVGLRIFGQLRLSPSHDAGQRAETSRITVVVRLRNRLHRRSGELRCLLEHPRKHVRLPRNGHAPLAPDMVSTGGRHQLAQQQRAFGRQPQPSSPPPPSSSCLRIQRRQVSCSVGLLPPICPPNSSIDIFIIR